MGLQRRTKDIIDTAVENLTDFTRGNVKGEHVQKGHSQSSWDRLPSFWVNVLNSDIADKDVYVLFSYQTPMAWFNGDSWVFPPESYTQSTTGHQHAFRVAIARTGKKVARWIEADENGNKG